jgi:HSP20 family protein
MAFRNLFNRGWDPLRELGQLQQEMDRLFKSRNVWSPAVVDAPLVNLWRGAEGALLTTEIPGVDPNELEVTVEGDTVSISGNRPPEQLGENSRYHRQERPTGRFSRSVEIPFRADPQKTEARYERGVLTIKLTQIEEEKPKKISVVAS